MTGAAGPDQPDQPAPADDPSAPDGIDVGGLWTYRWAASRRPRVHPVATPAGHVLTRDAPDDHPWHHALWFTIKFVDGDNFWEEYDAYGVLRHRGAPTVEEGPDGRVAVRGTLEWVRPDRETVALVEDRTWAHVPLGDDAYAIDLDTTLVADAEVHYDRTPFTTWGGYGGLTVRGAGDWVDTTLMVDDGSTHDRVLGDASRWCDLTGTVPGGSGAVAGMAFLDHPGNRRHPVPWYASTRADTYGDEGWSNFLNAAFLWHEGLDVAAGEPLRVRHRVVVHDGRLTAEQVEAHWQAYAAEG